MSLYNVPPILGLEFLVTHRCHLYLSDLYLEVRGKRCALEVPPTARAMLLTIANEKKLPPNAEFVLQLPSIHFQDAATALVEPCVDAELPKGVLIGRNLVDATRPTIPVRLCNTTTEEQVLSPGLILGRIEAAEVCELPTSANEGLPNTFDFGSTELSLEDIQKFWALARKYSTVFSVGPFDFERTHLVRHQINSKPIKVPARRIPLAKRQEATQLIQDMARRGVVEPSSSPWAALIVLVKKKDGSIRFCVDYRRLNDVTKKDSYLLPRIDELFTSLGGCKWFSTMVLQSGY